MSATVEPSLKLLAVLYVYCTSILDIVSRALLRERDQSWAISIVGSLAGAILIAPFVDFDPSIFTPKVILLFLLSGGLWALMVYWDFKAMVYSEASSNVLISSLRSGILVLIGFWFFDEPLTRLNVAGGIVILAGVLVAVPIKSIRGSKGFIFRIGSVAAGSAAILTDKVLIGLTEVRIVLFASYLLPGVLYLFVRPNDWRSEMQAGPARRACLLATAISLYIIIGPIFIGAFGVGQLSSTFFISQSRVVLTLVLSALLLREREDLSRKIYGAILCASGITMVIA